ncbi:hypothetical protein ACIBF5_18575 [Micromonospora sp. NPDC050417]|uniref:hypothetical protein n=1 Tax=Micromonospora sp. NPDC050417 TaxID=3364280 RepID=UPI00379BD0DB
MAAGLPAPTRRLPIRVWRLSGVERVLLANGATVVLKYAKAPFAREAQALTIAAARRIPVPTLRAATTVDGVLAMIISDLGQSSRPPHRADVATAAVRLHEGGPAPELPTVNQSTLQALPGQCLALVDHLHNTGRITNPEQLKRPLTALASDARRLAADTERPPYGLCHGELHPSAIHIGQAGWHLLDLALAHTGPGLLDLASWYGTRDAPKQHTFERLITEYIASGGDPAANTDRGRLPAAAWALGWHRITSAAWHLGQAVRDAARDWVDPADLRAAHRQLATAAVLLVQ